MFGSLQFSFDNGTTYTPYNWFDPANFAGAYVPLGFLNKTEGPTVTIANPATEFGFVDSGLPLPNYATANFTANGLSVDAENLWSSMVPWRMTFTSTAFVGQNLTLLDSTLPLASYSLVAMPPCCENGPTFNLHHLTTLIAII